MAEEIPPPPPQPKTKEIPKADPVEVLIREMRQEIRTSFQIQGDQLVDFGERLVRVEIRQKDLEDRVRVNSQRAREPSQHDLEAQAQLTQERAAREALALKVDTLTEKTDAQTAILEALKGNATRILKHPAMQALLIALVTFVTAWLARHT